MIVDDDSAEYEDSKRKVTIVSIDDFEDCIIEYTDQDKYTNYLMD